MVRSRSASCSLPQKPQLAALLKLNHAAFCWRGDLDQICKSPAEKEVSSFSRLRLTPLGLEASGLASLTANASHGKPPMIGPVAERHGGDKRAQPFAVIRFLFGRALSSSLALQAAWHRA